MTGERTLKIEAARAGVGVGEYQERLSQGLVYCYRCQDWHEAGAFPAGARRHSGRARSCHRAVRAAARKAIAGRGQLDLRGTGLGHIPVMLVNPSMENVVLVPDDDGKWHPQMHAVFAAMGMAPPGPGLRLYKPITGAAARRTASAVTITMKMPAPSDAYECAQLPAQP